MPFSNKSRWIRIKPANVEDTEGRAERTLGNLFELDCHWDILEQILLVTLFSTLPSILRVNKNILSCGLQSLALQCRLRVKFHGLDHLATVTTPSLYPKPPQCDILSRDVNLAKGLDTLQPFSFVNYHYFNREIIQVQDGYVLSLLCPSHREVPEYDNSTRRYEGEGWSVGRIRTQRPEPGFPPNDLEFEEYKVGQIGGRVDGSAMCPEDDVVAVIYNQYTVQDNMTDVYRTINIYKLRAFEAKVEPPRHPDAARNCIKFFLPITMSQRGPVVLRLFPGGILAVLSRGERFMTKSFVGVWNWKTGLFLGRVDCSTFLEQGHVYDIQLLSIDRLVCSTLHRIKGDKIIDKVLVDLEKKTPRTLTHLCVDVYKLAPPTRHPDTDEHSNHIGAAWPCLALPRVSLIATIALPALKHDRGNPRLGMVWLPFAQYHAICGRLTASGDLLGVNLSGMAFYRLVGHLLGRRVRANVTISVKSIMSASGLVKLVDHPEMWTMARKSTIPMAISGQRTVQIETSRAYFNTDNGSRLGGWVCQGPVKLVLRDHNSAQFFRRRSSDYNRPLGAPSNMLITKESSQLRNTPDIPIDVAVSSVLDKVASRNINPWRRLNTPLQPFIALARHNITARGLIRPAAWEFEENTLSARLPFKAHGRGFRVNDGSLVRKVLFDGERVWIIWVSQWRDFLANMSRIMGGR
ncbi:hypothetical protein BCR39DRAFT_271564 [Naematelia encephala]|uniref:Uncharacterized protein n=1 Tax=Naematelia encephala TaxID=71784 RepID=A0A1Y2AV52_9TREE|nr:hypothetical protein BCR39DRAFT_271564 [Naematelia encephala]